jgi:hypothetical protein
VTYLQRNNYNSSSTVLKSVGLHTAWRILVHYTWQSHSQALLPAPLRLHTVYTIFIERSPFKHDKPLFKASDKNAIKNAGHKI